MHPVAAGIVVSLFIDPDEETVRALIETFPILSRLKMLRMWGGIVDMTGDRSPILSKTPVENVFINCGWGTGGFKAIPGSGWATAALVAKGEDPVAGPFGLDRFTEGRMIDESVAAAVAGLLVPRIAKAGPGGTALLIAVSGIIVIVLAGLPIRLRTCVIFSLVSLIVL